MTLWKRSHCQGECSGRCGVDVAPARSAFAAVAPLSKAPIYHRDPEFITLFEDVRRSLEQ